MLMFWIWGGLWITAMMLVISLCVVSRRESDQMDLRDDFLQKEQDVKYARGTESAELH